MAKLTANEEQALIQTLRERFNKNLNRHPNIGWDTVEKALLNKTNKAQLSTLNWMEQTGGEPDVIEAASNSKTIYFFDCAVESPKGRRSFCYDASALASRKEFKPQHSACGLADEIGVELLGESDYNILQQTGAYDNKTSSWLKTPEEVRKKGGALFGDCRYGRVFTYHNGAESYYAARGFRSKLGIMI